MQSLSIGILCQGLAFLCSSEPCPFTLWQRPLWHFRRDITLVVGRVAVLPLDSQKHNLRLLLSDEETQVVAQAVRNLFPWQTRQWWGKRSNLQLTQCTAWIGRDVVTRLGVISWLFHLWECKRNVPGVMHPTHSQSWLHLPGQVVCVWTAGKLGIK